MNKSAKIDTNGKSPIFLSKMIIEGKDTWKNLLNCFKNRDIIILRVFA